MIFFLVFIKNEEFDFFGCFDFIFWSNDVVVYDFCSIDVIVEIVKLKKCCVIF